MSGGYQVPAIVSAAKILRELRQRAEGSATQAELVRATGLSKSTMHNLLSTLEQLSFVSRDGERRYRLGPGLITLGAAASAQAELIGIAQARLGPLASSHDVSFAVAQPVGDHQAVIVARFYPPHGVHVGIRIGTEYGPLDGAVGTCLLAALEPRDAERIARDAASSAREAASPSSTEPLLAAAGTVRERGWAASEQELTEANAVAAPVAGRDGGLELVLVAVGFAEQLAGERIERTGELLVSVASAIRAEAGISEAQR